ncbi:MAG: serine protease [Calditrichaeota bacterium]|nr:MAG: serine protease [Calditrichota bacterium]
MPRRLIYHLLFIFFISVIIFSCSRYVVDVSHPALQDGKYDSSFPIGSDDRALERVVESVRLVNASAQFKRYYFSREQDMRIQNLTPDIFKQHQGEAEIITDFVVGTATIIYADKRRLAVLSCAHVVDFPDTLIDYYLNADGTESDIISSVALKTRQKIHLSDLRQGEDVKILAIDRENDLVILGKEFLFPPSQALPVFPCPLGSAKELNWGNFVYIIGFPAGKKMITRGIISDPDRGPQHGFLLDALFNRGMSGGIVLAIRDGIPNFELVGIVNSVAADTEVRIFPQSDYDRSMVDTNIPYTGNLYLRSYRKINYGICFGISIETIQEFIEKNRGNLENAGFKMERFWSSEYTG